MRIDTRLRRLEKAAPSDDYLTIYELIRQGKFYDQLTADQRDEFCRYRGLNRAALEEVERAVNGTIHFPLTKKPFEQTKDQLQPIINEIERAVLDDGGKELLHE